MHNLLDSIQRVLTLETELHTRRTYQLSHDAWPDEMAGARWVGVDLYSAPSDLPVQFFETERAWLLCGLPTTIECQVATKLGVCFRPDFLKIN